MEQAVIETSAGTVQVHQNTMTQNKYYAYKFSHNFDKNEIDNEQRLLTGKNCFRQFQDRVKIVEEEYYLFNYQEGKTVKELISDPQYIIDQKTIEYYLSNLLKALYQLHQLNILGRVFSTSNIIDCKGKGLFMMDFGFGANFYQQNIEILLPPEMLEKISRIKYQPQQTPGYDSSSQKEFNLKLDSWLLGAFLFHLMRKVPICSYQLYKKNPQEPETFTYNQIEEYENFINLNKILGFEGVNFQNEQLPQKLEELIEGLLMYDPISRLSFSEIYKNQFVQDLNLKEINEILFFYENFETRSKLLFRAWPDQQSYRNSLQSSISKIFIYNAQDIDNSKNKNIWQYIQVEQFKYYLLNDTADNICSFLDDKEQNIQQISTYFLRRMSIIQLNELINCLEFNRKFSQRIDELQWQQFLNEMEVLISVGEFREELQKTKEKLKNYLIERSDKYQQSNTIDQQIKTDITYCINNQFDYQLDFQQLFQKAYFQTMGEVLDKIEKYEEIAKKQELCFKLVICKNINEILHPEKMNFKNIKFDGENTEKLKEIFQFITNENNIQEKQHEILYLKGRIGNGL